jgi:2-polyprenyl-6-methoxyphenol hydroxylase-like FAD-dependent oxidoreductase
MNKNQNEKQYDVTVIGGGLTGKLMIYLLIESGFFDKNRLCWINTEQKNNKDKRVSFINYKNFFKLVNSYGIKFLKHHYLKINKVEIHNMNELTHLSLEDKIGHGVIIRNDIFKDNLLISENSLTIYKSKVVSTNYDKFFRCLILENGMRVNTSLVLSADGNLSPLRQLSNIEYINHDLDHTIISGYLNARNFDTNTAKQIFLKDSFIGLLPYSKNVINFVWSLDNRVLSEKVNFNYHDEIIERLNSFFCKYDINFDQLKLPSNELQIYPISIKYVQKPFKKRLMLIGDAAHSIHPLAGQGFNLSIEDCFYLMDCIRNAKKIGKDYGDESILSEYKNLIQSRKNFITLITTILFYVFKTRNNYINKTINKSLGYIEKTSSKNIFKILARGY